MAEKSPTSAKQSCPRKDHATAQRTGFVYIIGMATTDLKPFRVPQLEGGRRPGAYAIFNSNSVQGITTTAEEWGSSRILLVHSKSLAASTNRISDLKAALGTRLVATKEGVGAHSPYSDVIEIAHLIIDQDIDCVVCVGSGSYSDACKTARILSATLPPGFGEADMEALIDQKIGIAPESAVRKAEGVKLILVPTSLSAGEWNYAASCTNSSGKKQHFALDDGCAPDVILMDPWLARTTPEKLWLSSGIRAIDHCVEMLCHEKSAAHPDAQQWCEDALRDLCKGLAEYKTGLSRGPAGEITLIEGISKCQAGSRMALMSLIVYRIPVGASHAIGHQLGSVAGVMHGITSCIMLAPVLRYTKDNNPMAQSRVLKAFNESMGWAETEAADCVARLVELLGLPSLLKDVGVTRDDQIESIVDKTMTDAIFSFGEILSRSQISEIIYSVK